MANRYAEFNVFFKTARQLAADGNQAAGVTLVSYTVPAGHKAKLVNATMVETAGAGSMRLVWTPSGGSDRTLAAAIAATETVDYAIVLDAGDVISIDVDVQEAAAVWDLTIGIEEQAQPS